jgi:amidohydrolase
MLRARAVVRRLGACVRIDEDVATFSYAGGRDLSGYEDGTENPKVDAVFGLHVFPFRAGQIVYRPGPLMASTDSFTIKVKGRQTHGAIPWGGIDPIVVGSQIVMGLQTIVSRQADITKAPAVVTVGRINGGIRFNIIPDSVFLEGTVRTFDPAMREDIIMRMRRTAESIAAGARHLKALMRRYRNDLALVAAAYNAGIGTVTRYGGVPPYAETQAYVAKVLALESRYRSALDARPH